MFLVIENNYKRFLKVFDKMSKVDRDKLIKTLEKIENYDEDEKDDSTFVHACFGGGKQKRNENDLNSTWNSMDHEMREKVVP